MKLKPILIPTDKQSIEVGDLTLPNYPNKINEGELGIAVRAFVRNDAYKAYDIILIDTEAEIVEGKLRYSQGDIQMTYPPESAYEPTGDVIIASTNKSHTVDLGHVCLDILPQLSNNSIQLLINYYNEHGELPESVEIEMEKTGYIIKQSFPKDCKDRIEPKLNEQGEIEIAIPEVEDKFINKFQELIDKSLNNLNVLPIIFDRSMYLDEKTKKTIIDIANKIASKEQDNNNTFIEFGDHSKAETEEYDPFKKNKEKLYTEEEIEVLLLQMCHDTRNYMENLRKGIPQQSSFNVKDWFQSKKK